MKPLSRALGSFPQEPILGRETAPKTLLGETLSAFCFGSFFSKASPRPPILSVKTVGRFARGTWNQGSGWGEIRMPAFQLALSSWCVLVSLLSLPRSSVKWDESRQEGCGNDQVPLRKPSISSLDGNPVWVQD